MATVIEPLELRGAANELIDCFSKEVLLEGPVRTGKTFAAVTKGASFADTFNNSRVLMCRKTRASMSQSILVTLERDILGVGHPLCAGAGRDHRQNYQFANGSEIVIGGLDNTDRIMSTEYDLIIVFEATEATEADWEDLLTRLSNGRAPYQQIIADCNPGPPSHWLNVRAKDGRMQRLKSVLRDNPRFAERDGKWTTFGKDYVETTLAGLRGVKRARKVDGVWAAADGLVYPTLADHVISALAKLPSPAIRVCAGLDWGWTDPTAIVVGAECQDGKIYIVDELNESKLPPDALAAKVRDLRAKWNIAEFYCDPSRPELISHMRRYDLPCVPHSIRLIESGIALVEARLLGGDGFLKVFDSCVEVLKSASEYEYGKTADGRTKTTPAPGNDHQMDALRYLICGMDFGRTLNFAAASKPIPVPEQPADETLIRLGHTPETPAQIAAREAAEFERQRWERAWS